MSPSNINNYDKNWRNAAVPNSSLLLNAGDPAVANSFLLEIDGVEIGIFKEVKGLEFTINTVDIPEGGQNDYMHRSVGRITWQNIILRRGMTVSEDLFDWVNSSSGPGLAANKNKLQLSTGAITAISHTGERLRAWNLKGAYPVKWRGPEFGVDLRTPLEEELEIAHQGFTSKTYPPKP